MNAIATLTATTLTIAPVEIDADDAANNAFADKGKQAADNLQTRAAKASLHALAKVDAWQRKAALALGLTLCAEQIRETLTGAEYSAETDKFVFRKVVLFPAALAGAMIYDNTETDVRDIRAAAPNSDERKALARAYTMRKMTKDTGFASSFKTQRTVGFRLAAWARINAKAELITIARLSMSSLDKAEESWAALVSRNFGDTFDRMAAKLAAWDAASKPAKAPKSGKGASVGAGEGATVDAAERAAQDAAHARRDPVAAIMAQVEGLTDAQLASLMMRIEAHAADRAKDAAGAAPVIALPAPAASGNLPARRAA